MRAIANAAYERTLKLLTEKKELMAAVAKLLLEKEVIHGDDPEPNPNPDRDTKPTTKPKPNPP